MSGKNKYKHIPAKTSPDGWIKMRKDKYEFAPVTRTTRASLTKEFVTVKQEFPTQNIDDLPPMNHCTKVSITSSKCSSFNPVHPKVDTKLVTPPKSM